MQWLTVFTFTPSLGVCLVVRLKPSILLASSPTTAGLWERNYRFKCITWVLIWKKKKKTLKCRIKKSRWADTWISISLSLESIVHLKRDMLEPFLGINVTYSDKALRLETFCYIYTFLWMNHYLFSPLFKSGLFCKPALLFVSEYKWSQGLDSSFW